MILATLGWACWWIHLSLLRFAPGVEPSFGTTAAVAAGLGVIGLALAFLTIRARASWMLFVVAAMFANASLLAFPWIAEDLFATGP